MFFFLVNLLLRFLISPIAAASFLKFQDINIFLALLLVWSSTFLLMLVTYFGIGTLAKRLTRNIFSRVISSLSGYAHSDKTSAERKFSRAIKHPKAIWTMLRSILGKWSFNEWLGKKSVWMLYILLLIPIPYLSSVVVVVVKVRKDMSGRKKAFILISTNLLKGILVVLSIYYFPILLTWRN